MVGVEEAKFTKGVTDVYLSDRIKTAITDIDNSASRIGFVIAQDSSAPEAISDCVNALSKITIVMDN